jgi:hypothetical protein
MTEIRFVISRNYREQETTGLSYILEGDEELLRFYTLELPLFTVPLKLNTVCTNCIPEGKYRVTKIYSPTKGKCFQVHDVVGRTAILIHKGNFATGKKVDTQGCILVGSRLEDVNQDGNLDVVESTVTLTKLLDLLPDEFYLTIL